jgi:hypothetical protein
MKEKNEELQEKIFKKEKEVNDLKEQLLLYHSEISSLKEEIEKVKVQYRDAQVSLNYARQGKLKILFYYLAQEQNRNSTLELGTLENTNQGQFCGPIKIDKLLKEIKENYERTDGIKVQLLIFTYFRVERRFNSIKR